MTFDSGIEDVAIGLVECDGASAGGEEVEKKEPKKETPKKEKEEVRNEPAHVRTPAKSPSRQ